MESDSESSEDGGIIFVQKAAQNVEKEEAVKDAPAKFAKAKEVSNSFIIKSVVDRKDKVLVLSWGTHAHFH